MGKQTDYYCDFCEDKTPKEELYKINTILKVKECNNRVVLSIHHTNKDRDICFYCLERIEDVSEKDK